MCQLATINFLPNMISYIAKAKPSWFTFYRPHLYVFFGAEQNFHNSLFLN